MSHKKRRDVKEKNVEPRILKTEIQSQNKLNRTELNWTEETRRQNLKAKYKLLTYKKKTNNKKLHEMYIKKTSYTNKPLPFFYNFVLAKKIVCFFLFFFVKLVRSLRDRQVTAAKATNMK